MSAIALLTIKRLSVKKALVNPLLKNCLFQMPKRKSSFWEKINYNAEANQSKLSMILGALIILVIGILVFNYFNRPKPNLGPSQQTENISSEKYRVKEGDTLFSVAEKFYQDGYKYQEIAKSNNLENPDLLEVGQTLEIPKLSSETITGDTYTVAEGDWLSKIAGRAYGDIYAYKKIVEANNIENPDLIFPGQIIKIPR